MHCPCGKIVYCKGVCKLCYYKESRKKYAHKRAEYHKERRQRPEVKARDAARTKERRATEPLFWAKYILITSRSVAKKNGYAPLDATPETLVMLREVFQSEVRTCYCCKRSISFDIPGQAFIDHCHTTGKLRGVVCGKCNHKVGILEGETATASQYLVDFG